MDSWIAWNLTGGVQGGLHITDATNASRTQMMDLETLQWDQDILDLFDIPRACLPEIRASSEVMGVCKGALDNVPLAGILGDQQAALFGQACLQPGQTKNTYGTGCFMLMNTGEKPFPSTCGLLTTLAYQLGERKAGLRAGRLHRHSRGSGAMAARQSWPDRQRLRNRGPRADRERQWRGLFRARLFRALCAALAQRRAGRCRRIDALRQQRPYRPRRLGGDCLSDARGARRHDAGFRGSNERIAGRWRHGRQ